MVTLIAEQVRQQNAAATATEAAAGCCCRRGLAAIVPSFCVACSAHIHIHSHAHTLSLAFTQLAHTPIHTHTHAHIYRQSAVCDFFFHFHINLLIFSYILWSRFTVSALQFSKFSEFCIQCTHFHFICFATSGCRQWRRLQRRRRPADFGRWNYFTCSCIFLFIFCICVPFAFAHTRLQLDCNWIILLTTKRCAFYLFQATAALPQFLTPTHTLIQIWNAPKTRLSRSLLTARMSDYRTLTKQCTVALTDCWTVS